MMRLAQPAHYNELHKALISIHAHVNAHPSSTLSLSIKDKLTLKLSLREKTKP
jgi:hypothetical protein